MGEGRSTLAGLAFSLRAGKVSPTEAVEGALERIERLDPALNAFLSVQGERALARARELERGSERGALYGVPLAVKDLVDVEGVPTSAASPILAGNVAAADAEVVRRLERAGAIVVGKLNTHEFAYGAMTTSLHYGRAHNPWDTERVTGGSSGGSGAAVAAGLVTGALGTDTAGSVRIPAAFCGVSGIRPSSGLVPTRGVLPLAWSFDAVGPLARTAEDCALLLQEIAGHDPDDPTSVAVPVPRAEAIAGGIKDLRIGRVGALFERGIDPRVAAVVDEAVDLLRGLGGSFRDVEVPLLDEAGLTEQAVQTPEATSFHLPWLRSRLADYGPDVRLRLLAGLFLDPTTSVTAQRARRVIAAAFAEVFESVDVLVTPTMPVVAPRFVDGRLAVEGLEIGDAKTTAFADDAVRLAIIRHTAPWSLVGYPAASVPCGFVDGLPVGLCVVGRRLDDATVLRACHAFQQETDWHERRPDVT